MIDLTQRRTAALQSRLEDAGIDVALVTDEDSIAYLAGFWGYLGVEFGRPTFLLVAPDTAPIVITPLMESEMVGEMTWVSDVRPWEDAGPSRWEPVLERALAAYRGKALGLEVSKLPPTVGQFLDERFGATARADVERILTDMRRVKGPEEIEVMRQAGQVGLAMVQAAKEALGEGVPEYEVALAAIGGGTRKAAEFLSDKGWDAFVSPLIHNLQILQSGAHTSMVHRRASVKRLERGDPVYMCFCNMVRFKQYKLGFDRQFYISEVNDEQAAVYHTTIAAQEAALGTIRAGAIAEDVHAAAEEVYRSAGFSAGYRTGRSIGMSYLEAPELKAGDGSVLEAGMTFAVDGGVSVPGKHAGRVGDSIVVTRDGFEYLTPYPKALCVV